MRAPLASVLVALALLGIPAGAEECVLTTSEAEVVVDGSAAGEPTYYLESDCGPLLLCQMGGLFSIWVYEESNGIEGLQRGDEMKDDTCGGRYPSDTVIF